jgi:hypothetical protein
LPIRLARSMRSSYRVPLVFRPSAPEPEQPMEAISRFSRPGRRAWCAMTVAAALGLLTVASVVDGQVGGRAPELPSGNSRPGPSDEPFRNTANSLTVPPARPTIGGSDELRRLQAEIEAIARMQEGLGDDPMPPAADSASERAKLRERLIELIDKLKSSSRSGSSPKAQSQSADPISDMRPIDRLKQAENLYRAGEVRSAQKVLQSIEPASLAGKQGILVRYLLASCHRRLGEYDQARIIYRDIAASKEDAFLAECAAWQLQAIRSREEIATQVAPTRTPSAPR